MGEKNGWLASFQRAQGVAVFEGKLKEAIFADQVKLLANVRAMGIHCARTDAEFGGDFPGRPALRDAGQDSPLGSAQQAEARRLPAERLGTVPPTEEKISQ